jgi:hypothetical protein
MHRKCIAKPTPQLDNEEFGTSETQDEDDNEQPNRTTDLDEKSHLKQRRKPITSKQGVKYRIEIGIPRHAFVWHQEGG